MNKKVILGQFFTTNNIWLRPHIKEFILSTGCKIGYDPFAGNGDLLKLAKEIGIEEIKGLDIDTSLGWEYNDSLLNIPHVDNSIIITNPPYISNYSASRKKVFNNVEQYFNNSSYNDVYLIALEKMLKSQDYVVAIIPETFINSSFRNKDRLYSITTLEENPFCDTDTPVLVACFDEKSKSLDAVKVYKNDDYIGSLEFLNNKRIEPSNNVDITFNTKQGWLGLRAIDLTDTNHLIHFDFKENIDYDWINGIKISSRLYSLIQINVKEEEKKFLIQEANKILFSLRDTTKDMIFSPFKGNMKNGNRRRRLDFRTARAILEMSYNNLKKGQNDEKPMFV